MHVFYYDKTLEGLLSVVFDAYTLRLVPDALLGPGDIAPLLTMSVHRVKTGQDKAGRVLAGLKKRLSEQARDNMMHVWLSEQPGSDFLLLRYMRKIFNSAKRMETDYADPDVLAMNQLSDKVYGEGHHLLGFARFQKTAEGIYFCPISPRYNVLPLILEHFADRFAEQPWIIYDLSRHYGVFYEQGTFHDVSMDESCLNGGQMQDSALADGEILFQQLWKSYCKAVTIRERTNLPLQSRLMPRYLWPNMTEKQH